MDDFAAGLTLWFGCWLDLDVGGKVITQRRETFMITEQVIENQLKRWKDLYDKKIVSLSPNRVSGDELHDWFVQKIQSK